jgi:hypothetical protein
MIDDYSFEKLRDAGESAVSRGRHGKDGASVLLLSAALEHPSPSSINQIKHAYSLRDGGFPLNSFERRIPDPLVLRSFIDRIRTPARSALPGGSVDSSTMSRRSFPRCRRTGGSGDGA